MPKFLIYTRQLACSFRRLLTHARAAAAAEGEGSWPTYVIQMEQVSPQAGGEVAVDASLLSTEQMRHGSLSCLVLGAELRSGPTCDKCLGGLGGRHVERVLAGPCIERMTYNP